MKASLQLRLGQQLTMTPQLQQAIRLLQLSTLDLQQEINEALESNPLLEQDESVSDNSNDTQASEDFDNSAAADYTQTASEATAEIDGSETGSDNSSIETSEALGKEQMGDDLPMDTTWDEYYTASSAASAAPRDDDFQYQGETAETLQEHLLWQMELTPFSDTDRAIAVAIIDAVEDSGYLSQGIEDILEAMGDPDVSLDEVAAVLKRIQHFDPIGVAARSPQESLQIQLSHFDPATPWLKEAQLLLTDYMDLLAARDYRLLARKTKLKEHELSEAIRLIQSLNPRPGNTIVDEDDQYVIPDVSVQKKNGRWVVELNPDCLPKLRVNEQYAAMSRGATNRNDSQFIRGHLQEAKWFIKSLESRNETLLKVANCIVAHQRGFFEYGEEAMKPLVLNDVAEAVEMHESTISRVTTQKYMHTPRGIFELKYFFSSHVSTENGGECSSTAIRAIIKKLVAAEKPQKNR